MGINWKTIVDYDVKLGSYVRFICLLGIVIYDCYRL